jgi:hypothetical protein
MKLGVWKSCVIDMRIQKEVRIVTLASFPWVKVASEATIKCKASMVPALVYAAYCLANPAVLLYRVSYAAAHLRHSGVKSSYPLNIPPHLGMTCNSNPALATCYAGFSIRIGSKQA